jgi:hypothetical protein
VEHVPNFMANLVKYKQRRCHEIKKACRSLNLTEHKEKDKRKPTSLFRYYPTVALTNEAKNFIIQNVKNCQCPYTVLILIFTHFRERVYIVSLENISKLLTYTDHATGSSGIQIRY